MSIHKALYKIGEVIGGLEAVSILADEETEAALKKVLESAQQAADELMKPEITVPSFGTSFKITEPSPTTAINQCTCGLYSNTSGCPVHGVRG